MNNNQGISLIALIVTIIVMIILAGSFVAVSNTGLETASDARIQNEKKQIETAAVQRFASYMANEDAFPLVGSDVTVEELNGIDGISIEDIDYIKKINATDIQSLEIKNTTGFTYIVDYFSGEVYGPIREAE